MTNNVCLHILCSLLLGLAVATPGHADVEIGTEHLRLRFADNGDLLEVHACLPACNRPSAHRLDIEGEGAVVSFTSYAAEPFTLERTDGEEYTDIRFENPANQSFRRWRIPVSGWRLELEAAGVERIDIAGGERFRRTQASGFGAMLEQPRYLVFDGGDVETIVLNEAVEPRQSTEWTGFRNRFWAIVVQAHSPIAIDFPGSSEALGPGMVLQPDPAQSVALSVYLGPAEPGSLASADPVLTGMMYSGLWFWLRWICQALNWLFGLIYHLVPHWALAIMLLSLAVSVLMRPLSRIADRLQDDVHRTEAALAPELQKIRVRYKGEAQSERILKMYKDQGVHPLYSLKSLVGVMLVIPIFIGAFDMLAENIWLSGTPFLWIEDLSRPDAFAELPFSIPFFGHHLNLLPFIMAALSVVASVLHRHEAMDEALQRRHIRKLSLMAVAFLALFYTFPAGMVLYWTTNNLVSVIKYGWKRFRTPEPPPV